MCETRIYERNFDHTTEGNDHAAICENCLDGVIHRRCMDRAEARMFDSTRIWFCTDCDLDSSVEMEIFDEDSSSIGSETLN